MAVWVAHAGLDVSGSGVGASVDTGGVDIFGSPMFGRSTACSGLRYSGKIARNLAWVLLGVKDTDQL